ncbi:MAG: excinuclease ABC subunit UvrC, partial [candidate division KSB1 bacterium]|nr:excinuclease ABC subunit UvrC [candidate division KSB1 bacterium]
MNRLQEKLEQLSDRPGVYLFKDREGRIIYIGKAKVLRNRVRSYFQDSRRFDPKTQHLVARIADVETIITDTEIEALILEATLVKEHQPRYNINLKDDKSFPFIRVTNELYPRIFPTRRIVRDGSRYFGPYTDVHGMKALLATAKKLFPIRSCNLPLTEESIRSGKYKVCLNYHIHRCHGPCEGLIDREEYLKIVEYVVDFIKGRTELIEADIRRRMQQAAVELKFELAARLRDQLKAVEQFSHRQKVLDPEFSDRDVVSLALDEEEACCLVFKVRRGRLIGKEFFILQHTEGESAEKIVASFLQQFYLSSEDIPPEILIPCEPEEELRTVEKWLSESANNRVALIFPRRGEKARLLQMGERNARRMMYSSVAVAALCMVVALIQGVFPIWLSLVLLIAVPVSMLFKPKTDARGTTAIDISGTMQIQSLVILNILIGVWLLE